MADNDLTFILYCVTHRNTGRSYVGQTCIRMEWRWAKHCYIARSKTGKGCTYLDRAIQKYGPEAFDVVQIASANSREEINCLEKLYIKALNCRVPDGFNIEEGGCVYEMSQETRDKIAVAHRGKPKLALRGKKRPPEVIEKIKAVRTANNSWGRSPGFHHSPETIAKIKASNIATAAVRHG